MSNETEITAWLATQRQAMTDLLRDMVDTDSGSYNKAGIDAVGAVVERFLSGQGIPVERVVLGDWYEQGSVLRVDRDGVVLEGIPL